MRASGGLVMCVVVVHLLLFWLQVSQWSHEFGWWVVFELNHFRHSSREQASLGGRGGMRGFGSWRGSIMSVILSVLCLLGQLWGHVVVSVISDVMSSVMFM